MAPRPILDVEPLARNGEKGYPGGKTASLARNGATVEPEGGAVNNVALDCVSVSAKIDTCKSKNVFNTMSELEGDGAWACGRGKLGYVVTLEGMANVTGSAVDHSSDNGSRNDVECVHSEVSYKSYSLIVGIGSGTDRVDGFPGLSITTGGCTHTEDGKSA